MGLAGERKSNSLLKDELVSEFSSNEVGTLGVVPNQPSKNSWVHLFLGLLIPILSLSPLLVIAVRDLWAQIPYRFFPASIGIGILFLIYSMRGYQPASVPRQRLGTILTLLGIAIGLWAMFSVAANRAIFAAFLIVTGWAIKSFGGIAWTRVFAICSLFAVIVPFPRGLGTMLMNQLQFAAGWCTSAFLEFWSVPNVFENNVLRIAGKQMATWEICGDAGSCFALIAFALAWCIFRRRSMFVTVATIAATLLLSMFGDFLRLNLITWLSQGMDIDATRGSFAIWVGIAIFLMNAFFVVTSDISIAALFGPVILDESSRFVSKVYQRLVTWPATVTMVSTHPNWKEKEAAPPQSGPIVPAKQLDWLLWVPCLLSLCGGALCLWVLYLSPQSTGTSLAMSVEQADRLPGKEALPKEFGTLRQINYSTEKRTAASLLGQHTHSWQYDNGETQVMIHLDFPFSGWTIASKIYSMLGWELNRSEKQEFEGNSPWTMQRLTMTNRFGVNGNAWQAMFLESGEPVQALEQDPTATRTNLFSMLAPSATARSMAQRHFQVRMFFETGRELTSEETDRYSQFFVEIFNRIRLQSATSLDSQGSN